MNSSSTSGEYTESPTYADLVPLKLGSWVEFLIFPPVNAAIIYLMVKHGRRFWAVRQRQYLDKREPFLVLAFSYGWAFRSFLSMTVICFPGLWICSAYKMSTALVDSFCFSSFLLRFFTLYFKFLLTNFAILITRVRQHSTMGKIREFVLKNRVTLVTVLKRCTYFVFAVNGFTQVLVYLVRDNPAATWVTSAQAACNQLFDELYYSLDIGVLGSAMCLIVIFAILLYFVKENYKIKFEILCIGLAFLIGTIIRSVLDNIPGMYEILLTWFDYSSIWNITLPNFPIVYYSLYLPVKISEEIERQKQAASADIGSQPGGGTTNISKESSMETEDPKKGFLEEKKVIPIAKTLRHKIGKTKALDTFLSYIEDAERRKVFEQFLCSEFAIENLLFYNEASNFRKAANTREARRIYDTFIAENSSLSVNISSESRRNLNTKIIGVELLDSKELSSLFDEAVIEVLRLMYRDSFIRFQFTSSFKNSSTPTAIEVAPLDFDGKHDED